MYPEFDQPFQMRLLLVVIAVSFFSCNGKTDHSKPKRFEITDFRQGKMREELGSWSIYDEGPIQNYEINGECEFNGRWAPCMWYGYAFSFKTNYAKPVLKCKYVSDAKSTIGNPEEILDEDTTHFEFEITLNGSEEKFINPQYAISTTTEQYTENSSTSCTHEGKLVLQIEKTIIFGGPATET